MKTFKEYITETHSVAAIAKARKTLRNKNSSPKQRKMARWIISTIRKSRNMARKTQAVWKGQQHIRNPRKVRNVYRSAWRKNKKELD